MGKGKLELTILSALIALGLSGVIYTVNKVDDIKRFTIAQSARQYLKPADIEHYRSKALPPFLVGLGSYGLLAGTGAYCFLTSRGLQNKKESSDLLKLTL